MAVRSQKRNVTYKIKEQAFGYCKNEKKTVIRNNLKITVFEYSKELLSLKFQKKYETFGR
jgi:hypothetical protein